MNVTKKMDDIGRITIPKDIRNSLRWMGGDEIEIIMNNDGTVLLRKNENDTTKKLEELRAEWSGDPDVEQRFLELIELIKSK